jgi:hypothetical protein
MPVVNLSVSVLVVKTARVLQLEWCFDVPPSGVSERGRCRLPGCRHWQRALRVRRGDDEVYGQAVNEHDRQPGDDLPPGAVAPVADEACPQPHGLDCGEMRRGFGANLTSRAVNRLTAGFAFGGPARPEDARRLGIR